MTDSKKYIIIYDHENPEKELSFDDLRKVMRFLDEADVSTMAFGGATAKPKEKKPDFDKFAEKLSALTDTAEEYRDMLTDFIKEADALLEQVDTLTEHWDDEE